VGGTADGAEQKKALLSGPPTPRTPLHPLSKALFAREIFQQRPKKIALSNLTK